MLRSSLICRQRITNSTLVCRIERIEADKNQAVGGFGEVNLVGFNPPKITLRLTRAMIAAYLQRASAPVRWKFSHKEKACSRAGCTIHARRVSMLISILLFTLSLCEIVCFETN